MCALNIANLDRVTKDDVKTGEGLKSVQDFVNKNVAVVAGNRQQPAPNSVGLVPLAPAVSNAAVVRQSPPPATIINDPGGIGGRRS